MSLFQYGEFQGAAGQTLLWKIECDSLTQSDWDCIAKAAAPAIGPFRYLFGVPTGGYKLACAFAPYIDWSSDIMLIVDDVWTTGKSMYAYADRVAFTEWKGFVGFARNPLPYKIKAFMKLGVYK